MFSQHPLLCNLAGCCLVFGCFFLQSRAAVTEEEINLAFQIPIWTDANLWDDPADIAAQRLNWPEESKTSTDSSYRKYPEADDTVLGARPYSLALYGEDGSVSGLSMMFANKGDSVPSELVAGDVKPSKKQKDAYKELISRDAENIEQRLTALLGPPQSGRFGQGRQTREAVKRWDWNGHAILLASPKDEYVAVRILPADVADNQGRSRITDAALRERLLSRVERRSNGDVILKDIPMVNQGPKGYCVPATWERAMRYMAIPADMYVLAMAGNTIVGGGTSLPEIVAGARESVTRGGRRLDVENGKVQIRNVKRYIDRGLPVMWTMYSMDAVNADLNLRMTRRSGMTDPIPWTKELEPNRKAAKNIPVNSTQGHMCMIIGYNIITGEVAVSDSWGPAFAERWMTEEEANAVSQGQFSIINF